MEVRVRNSTEITTDPPADAATRPSHQPASPAALDVGWPGSCLVGSSSSWQAGRLGVPLLWKPPLETRDVFFITWQPCRPTSCNATDPNSLLLWFHMWTWSHSRCESDTQTRRLFRGPALIRNDGTNMWLQIFPRCSPRAITRGLGLGISKLG